MSTDTIASDRDVLDLLDEQRAAEKSGRTDTLIRLARTPATGLTAKQLKTFRADMERCNITADEIKAARDIFVRDATLARQTDMIPDLNAEIGEIGKAAYEFQQVMVIEMAKLKARDIELSGLLRASLGKLENANNAAEKRHKLQSENQWLFPGATPPVPLDQLPPAPTGIRGVFAQSESKRLPPQSMVPAGIHSGDPRLDERNGVKVYLPNNSPAQQAEYEAARAAAARLDAARDPANAARIHAEVMADGDD